MNYSEYRDRFSSVEEFMRDFGKRTYEEAYEMIDAEICPDSIKGCMIQKWHQARRKAKLGSICVDIGDNGALRIVFFENDSDIDGNDFQYGYWLDGENTAALLKQIPHVYAETKTNIEEWLIGNVDCEGIGGDLL